MNTKNHPHITAANVGLSTIGLSLFSQQVGAMEGVSSKVDLLFWLNDLPDWVPMLILAALFAGLTVLILAMLRRMQGGAKINSLVSYSAVAAGVLVGIIVAQQSIMVWQAYIYEELNRLPKTTSGVPSAPTLGAMNLLDEVDIGEAPIAPKTPKKVLSGRVRHVKINFNAINADTLDLNLFGDTNLTAVRDRIVNNVQGGLIWIGHIVDYPDSEVILAVKGKALMGTVETGGRSFEIVYVGGATHAVRELDPNKIPDKYEPEDFAPNSSEGTTGGGDTTSTSSASATSASDTVTTGQVIDLLAAYTPQARTNAGGVSGIESRILNAVTKTNQAYLNSQVNMMLNIVGMVEINYVETGDMTDALPRLQGTTDGYMDNIHALRDQYGADQVTLISADSNYCGYASVMTTVDTGFAPYAFSVVHDDSVYNCLGSNNTLAHELGHNQGNVHNIENTSIAGAAADAYGYRVCGVFRDIMAYSCSGETRIPYFSNPNVYWNSQPTGILGSANTARSMNATAPTVASFRTLITTAPNAPSSLLATSSTSDSIALTWTDNASDETGYVVQRSPDGAAWSQVAALGQNAAGFTDTGLSSGQAYYYQVYAYNSVGNSAFSNTSTATTMAPQLKDTTPPVVSITKPQVGVKLGSPTQQVSVIATDNVGVKSLQLSIDNKVVSSTNSGSLSYNWSTKKVMAGAHTLSAQTVDLSGNSSSASVTVNK